MADNKEIKQGENQNAKPADVSYEKYAQAAYERDLYREMIVQLNVEIYWLKRQINNGKN